MSAYIEDNLLINLFPLKVRPWTKPFLYGASLTVPWLMSASATVAIWRVRRPRPPWRILLRQPGTTACVVAVMMLAVQGTLMGIAWAAKDVPGLSVCAPLNGFTAAPICYSLLGIGQVVLGVWLVQAASGRWRAEPSWIDRIGRLVGVGWIAASCYQEIAGYIN
jgi:hypothetical protein